jgi:hypothetical protein
LSWADKFWLARFDSLAARASADTLAVHNEVSRRLKIRYEPYAVFDPCCAGRHYARQAAPLNHFCPRNFCGAHGDWQAHRPRIAHNEGNKVASQWGPGYKKRHGANSTHGCCHGQSES